MTRINKWNSVSRHRSRDSNLCWKKKTPLTHCGWGWVEGTNNKHLKQFVKHLIKVILKLSVWFLLWWRDCSLLRARHRDMIICSRMSFTLPGELQLVEVRWQDNIYTIWIHHNLHISAHQTAVSADCMSSVISTFYPLSIFDIDNVC